LLAGALGAAYRRHQIGQQLALDYLHASQRQPLRAGFDAAGLHDLHPPAAVRIHHHVAVEFHGTRNGLFRAQHGTDRQAPLRLLGHENAAIGQPLRFVCGNAGRRLGCVAAVIFVAVRTGLGHRECQQAGQ
jgi:hypothetical protein